MNFVSGILIVIACSYLGAAVDGYYKTKILLLNEFLDFIEFAAAEINYMKTDVMSLIKKFPSARTGLPAALKMLEDPSDTECCRKALPWLMPHEKTLICGFITGIARLDLASQKGYAEEYKARTTRLIADAQNVRDTRGKLAKKLAPLLGLAIMIIIL